MFRLPSPQELVIVIPVFLLALTIHEFAHGWVANRLGDPTARLQGRLTLNPMAHLDIIGTIAIVLIGFGWAKPVPVDARYFRQPRRDTVLVAVAGPLSNLILAVSISLLLQVMPWAALGPEWLWLTKPLYVMLNWSVVINVLLAVFNLLPIPPLDGSRVVAGLLPLRQAISYSRIEPYGFIVIFLLFYTGIIQPVFSPIVGVLTHAIFSLWG